MPKKRKLGENDLPIIQVRKPKGLEDYSSEREIAVEERDLKYATQRYLFGGVNPSKGLKPRIGKFFEILSKGIYGGDPKEQYELDGEDIYAERGVNAEPDITNASEKLIQEIKGVASNQQVKLKDKQVGKYVLMQTKDIVYNDPLIRFEIFRYGIYQPIKKFEKRSLDDLIFALAENIRYLVSLPFSVIFELYRGDHSLGSRYDGEVYDSLRRVGCRGLNDILADPEGSLKKIGLKPKDFEIRKRRFPKNVRINKKEIKQFPILAIRDQNHGGWLQRFKERIEREREDYRKKKETLFITDPLFDALEELENKERELKEVVPFEIPAVGKDYDPSEDGSSEKTERDEDAGFK